MPMGCEGTRNLVSGSGARVPGMQQQQARREQTPGETAPRNRATGDSAAILSGKQARRWRTPKLTAKEPGHLLDGSATGGLGRCREWERAQQRSPPPVLGHAGGGRG